MAQPAPSLTLAPPRAHADCAFLEAHDREQLALEIRHASGSATAGGVHDLELYLFIPRNVGLRAANYPSADFYNDLTTYLRLDMPALDLEDLRAGVCSPLRDLHVHLAELAQAGANPAQVAVAVKLFGHELTETVHRERVRLLRVIREGTGDLAWRGELSVGIGELVAASRAALGRLREAGRGLAPFRRVAPDVWDVFEETDEYASLVLDDTLATLAHELCARPDVFDGSGWIVHVRDVLSSYAASEAAYRRAQGFVNLDPSSGANREYFLYRRSLLKKAVQQALWVETRRRKADRYVRNAAAMVAAGLAATWALIAQLPARFMSLSASMQVLMFVVPVIAYVAKDRIKELTKEWLIRRLDTFDQETELVGSQLVGAGLGSLHGCLREKVRFIDRAPEDVLAVRRRSRWIAGSSIGAESVLLYRRTLEIAAPLNARPRGRDQLALRQIIRLNLRHFMTRLDEREQLVRHYEPSAGGFATRELAKVYHLNVVARIGGSGAGGHLERWRVVFSRAGIERIEHPPATG
jgi:hypothetical protein